MEETVLLRLKEKVTLAEKKGKSGLCLEGKIKWAISTEQEIILRALILEEQSVDSLSNILRKHLEQQIDEAYISLELASFILDYGEYLEESC